MKIISETISYTTRFLHFMVTAYLNKDGKESEWFWVTRPGRSVSAVVIAAIVKQEDGDKLVVTKEYRVPLKDYEWGLPAGLVDTEESPIYAATRELKEETGLDVSKVLKVSPPIYSSAGLTDESVTMCFVEAMGEVSQDGNEASEDIATYILSREEVVDLLKSEDKKLGAKAWFVMSRFAETGEI